MEVTEQTATAEGTDSQGALAAADSRALQAPPVRQGHPVSTMAAVEDQAERVVAEVAEALAARQPEAHGIRLAAEATPEAEVSPTAVVVVAGKVVVQASRVCTQAELEVQDKPAPVAAMASAGDAAAHLLSPGAVAVVVDPAEEPEARELAAAVVAEAAVGAAEPAAAAAQEMSTGPVDCFQ